MNLDRLTIELPWPDMGLMPNRKNGRHWTATHGKMAAARDMAALAARQALGRNAIPSQGRMKVTLTFVAPDRRRRDIDNLLACMKSQMDGIAIALGVDDSQFRPITLDDGLDTARRGFVRVDITAASEV
ncbi:RusA family crossover junction endodeoxyribonuclease [Orrella dioscoreae]|nr:RusA family crossover junction endodeoxyribonuclease [Orrella dioscoreae]